MVVLVGLPGSGKSTFAQQLQAQAAPGRWERINQDELGSAKHCHKRAAAGLAAGRSLLIDRTNIDEGQRAQWIRLAHEFGTPRVYAVHLQVPLEVCKERVMSRTGHKTLPASRESMGIVERFASTLVPPYPGEGFVHVTRVQPDEEVWAEALAATDALAPPQPRPLTRDSTTKTHSKRDPWQWITVPIRPRPESFATSSFSAMAAVPSSAASRASSAPAGDVDGATCPADKDFLYCLNMHYIGVSGPSLVELARRLQREVVPTALQKMLKTRGDPVHITLISPTEFDATFAQWCEHKELDPLDRHGWFG